ncbi:MAG: putative toxin-antitoxin system toxin component, PIN family [candidate division KSB1 bacterium]
MIAVIDTNIFMAARLNPPGAPAKIRRRWRQRQFEILISDEIFDEYSDVLKHAPAISEIDVQLLLDELRFFAQRVTISGMLHACKDLEDDKFLETAVTGGADFLVTKNLKHFPRKSHEGVRIVNVANFLNELEKTFIV